MNLSEEFWDNRYLENDTGWDLGTVSPPLKTYFDQLSNKDVKILIPGGGNAYEATYLYKKGFKNVYVADISKTALSNLQKRDPIFPASQLIHQNFFDLEMSFDIIIEQTFFCAIHPSLREAYVLQSHSLLNDTGKLVGLLFDAPLNTEHPPFGGNNPLYKKLFEPRFNIEIMSPCYNSVESRKGKELFFKLSKKY